MPLGDTPIIAHGAVQPPIARSARVERTQAAKLHDRRPSLSRSLSVCLMETTLRAGKAKFRFQLSRFSCSTPNAGFDKLVDTICKLINREDLWSSSLEKSIASAAPNFHSRLLFRVLKLQTNPHMACELFHWAYRIPNFTHTPFTYCALIEVLARFKHFDQIWSLIHDMQASNISISPVPFATLINAYGNAGLIEDAQRAFDAISTFGCRPNVYVYNALLNAQSKAQRTMDAFGTLKRMRDDGCTPDVVTYTTLITDLSNAGKVDKVSELMEEMMGEDCMPNTWTFTAIIQGFLKAEKEMEALSTLETMLDKGCLPDTVTYNSLLQWFFSKGNSDKAMHMFEQMSMKGCIPDALTYGILINGLLSSGKIEAVIDLLRRMATNGCNPDASVFNALTIWLCEDATSEHGVQVLDCILSIAYQSHVFNYARLIDGLLKAKRADIMFTTVKGLLARGICPDKTVCTPIINWLCKQGRTGEVVELLEKVADLQAPESAVCG